jgi:para-aminobenzoate synthetase component I
MNTLTLSKIQSDTFRVNDTSIFRIKMLNWISQFGIFCFLDTLNPENESGVQVLAGVNAKQYIEADTPHVFDSLKKAIQQKQWWMGHVAYDSKNEIEKLESKHHDGIGFPDLFLFSPEILIKLKDQEVSIESSAINPEQVFQDILTYIPEQLKKDSDAYSFVDMQPRFSREEYIKTVKKLKEHIARGDCYEINFCQEFYAEDISISPLHAYLELTRISPTPFSSFYRLNERYLVCASPERFLEKRGDLIRSQPIKGTIARNLNDPEADKLLASRLKQNAKERSENIMVTDLVRNDISKISKEGSVTVPELCAVYSFPQVHHLISTVEGTLLPDKDIADVLQACMPMGSMTGAPKKRVMELIEQYERTRRGVYSGCVGYITPESDCDWNVVIRSLLYNQENNYLSYQVGSAITFYSYAEKEYEECLLKASAIRQVLEKY